MGYPNIIIELENFLSDQVNIVFQKNTKSRYVLKNNRFLHIRHRRRND